MKATAKKLFLDIAFSHTHTYVQPQKRVFLQLSFAQFSQFSTIFNATVSEQKSKKLFVFLPKIHNGCERGERKR